MDFAEKHIEYERIHQHFQADKVFLQSNNQIDQILQSPFKIFLAVADAQS